MMGIPIVFQLTDSALHSPSDRLIVQRDCEIV